MIVQVSAKVTGNQVSADCRDASVYERCGIALARFHSAAASYPRASQFDEQAWETEWPETKSNMPTDNQILVDEYARIDAWLKASCPLPGGKGLTHGDPNIFNFIDDGSEVSLIDIDSPDFTWFANDLTGPFRQTQPDFSPSDRVGMWSGFASGYRSLSPIALDFESIRWLLRQGMLVSYVAYARMPNPEQKDYLKRWFSFIEDPGQW